MTTWETQQLFQIQLRKKTGCTAGKCPHPIGVTVQRLGKDEPGLQRVARLHAARSNDVTTFAIGILDESDVRAAVRIVFDSLDDSGNTVLVALEIDDAVMPPVPPAAVAAGHCSRCRLRCAICRPHPFARSR